MAGVEDVDIEPREKEFEKVKERNTDLLIQIAQLCNRPDRTYPEVVFLLGTPGAGKSAMVNTMVKALCGKYYSKALTGKGQAQTKTLTLQSFVQCGIKKYDMEPLEKDILKKGLSKLPTIIDAAGKGDEDSGRLKEILRAYFGGYVSPGTSIQFLDDKQSEHGIGSLQDHLECSDENKVTKVIFVASCQESFPGNLVDCLQSVLREYDDRSGKPKYPVDVFVVITKYDLVHDQKLYEAQTTGEKIVTEEVFKKFEAKVANHFSMEGSMESNCFRWVSYVDGHGSDNPYIDNIALRFIEKMMHLRRGHDYGKPTKKAAASKLKSKKESRDMEIDGNWNGAITFGVVVVILAIMIYYLLTKRAY
ncbi:uncharacterized protein LOC128224359 [Mya arenaria]|uniref:uncharacterized protein LOC128224359 n=1 Tax=Mya arenaria TaxID=6604 RepID=UPI0022DFCA84|nr:uncharacterized protein LOC128223844 isoform X1 [Mya arenaria]XP_052790134.1 uncharacterized protein LOC128224359 [Mya arenaria]